MFGTLTIISALTSVALAQSSSSSAAPGGSTQSPLVPSTVSTTCAAFLNNLNTDSGLKTCLDSLISATSSFSPGTNVAVTKATVSSALGSLCSDSVSAACPEQYIRTKITAFWTECNDELTKKNPDVIKLYDTIYTMSPFRTSVCSKDDSGTYCALASPSGGTKETSSSSIVQLLSALYTTGAGALTRRAPAVSPNMATFHDNNLVFLYYNPDLDASALCTTCVRQILAAYVTFVSNVAYGPGLANSQLLDKQPALYEAVKNKCPAGFLSGPVQAAGGLSGGTLSGALATAAPQHTTMIAFLLGLSSLAISFMF